MQRLYMLVSLAALVIAPSLGCRSSFRGSKPANLVTLVFPVNFKGEFVIVLDASKAKDDLAVSSSMRLSFPPDGKLYLSPGTSDYIFGDIYDLQAEFADGSKIESNRPMSTSGPKLIGLERTVTYGLDGTETKTILGRIE